MILNNIDVSEYITHPRILELRLVLIFDLFEKNYGNVKASVIFEALAKSHDCNNELIRAVLNKRFDIKRKCRYRSVRWKQEVLFACRLYDESIYKTCKLFLGIHPSNVYGKNGLFNTDKFISQEWLLKLDDEADLAAMKIYRIELIRFLELMNNLADVLSEWKGTR